MIWAITLCVIMGAGLAPVPAQDDDIAHGDRGIMPRFRLEARA
jgi:hypothetical protein